MKSNEKPPDGNRLQPIEKNPPSSIKKVESGYVDRQPPILWTERDLAELKRDQ
jgi:hypothetical protein